MSVEINNSLAGFPSGDGNAVELQDVPVSATAPNDNDVLTYDSGAGEWAPAAAAAGGASTALDNLASVAINSALIFADNVTGVIRTIDDAATAADMNVTAGSGVTGGNITLQTGDGTTGASGYLGIYTGETATGFQSGPIDSATGEVTAGTGSSGYILWATGAKSGGASGNTGTFDVYTGDHTATTGNSGNITFQTGQSTNGNSGDIQLITGTAGVTKGTVKVPGARLQLGGTTNSGLLYIETSSANDLVPAISMRNGNSPTLNGFDLHHYSNTENGDLILYRLDNGSTFETVRFARATGTVSVDGTLVAGTLTAEDGASGSFTTVDAKTVTVVDGIITSIV